MNKRAHIFTSYLVLITVDSVDLLRTLKERAITGDCLSYLGHRIRMIMFRSSIVDFKTGNLTQLVDSLHILKPLATTPTKICSLHAYMHVN